MQNLSRKKRLMKMQNWIDRVDAFLRFNEYKVLDNAGSIRKDVADKFAEGEYAKYKVLKDKDFNKDFDKIAAQIRNTNTLPKEITITEKKESDFDRKLKGLLSVPPPKKEN